MSPLEATDKQLSHRGDWSFCDHLNTFHVAEWISYSHKKVDSENKSRGKKRGEKFSARHGWSSVACPKFSSRFENSPTLVSQWSLLCFTTTNNYIIYCIENNEVVVATSHTKWSKNIWKCPPRNFANSQGSQLFLNFHKAFIFFQPHTSWAEINMFCSRKAIIVNAFKRYPMKLWWFSRKREFSWVVDLPH